MKLTRYERARLIGARALQLSMGAPFLVKLSNEDMEKIRYNPIEIAKIELSRDVLPINVRRSNEQVSRYADAEKNDSVPKVQDQDQG